MPDGQSILLNHDLVCVLRKQGLTYDRRRRIDIKRAAAAIRLNPVYPVGCTLLLRSYAVSNTLALSRDILEGEVLMR